MHGLANFSSIIESGNGLRAFLSLKEAIVIAEVREEKVRKDLETGLLTAPIVCRLPSVSDGRLGMRWAYVFTLAAVYGNELLTRGLRKHALHRMDDLVTSMPIDWTCFYHHKRANKCFSNDRAFSSVVELDKYVSLDLCKVVTNVKPRVDLYAAGLERITERDDVLGGDAVFRGTRLPVSHIGKMFEDGATLEEILCDYRGLTEDDVKFAKLYYHAHPPVGRPRARAEARDDDSLPPAA